MSKSKKRTIVRLLIVTVVVGLGVFAIVQAQRGALKPTGELSPQANPLPTSPANSSLTPISADPGGDPYSPSQSPAGLYRTPDYNPENTDASPPAGQNDYAGDYGSATHDNGGAFTTDSPAHLRNRDARDQTVSQTIDQHSPPVDPFSSRNLGASGSSYTTIPPASSAPAAASISDTPLQPGSPPDFGANTGPMKDITTTQLAQQSDYGTSGGAPPPSYTSSQYDSPSQSPVNMAVSNPAAAGDSFQAQRQYPYSSGQSQPGILPRAGANDSYRSATSVSTAIGRAEGNGSPGQSTLEGVQAPSLTIEKQAPAEIQVGKPATFRIKIQNVGRVEATDVIVLDQVPRGTQFIDAQPPAEQGADGTLIWRLGALKPGDETTISLQLLPLAEGEIGSVAKVVFQAQASVRTVCTCPQLTVSHSAPPRVLIGQSINLSIEISNPGSGDATGVILEENIPEAFAHPAGNELEYEIGVLRPGESRKIELTLTAERPGIIENVLLVRGEGNLIAEDRIQIEVIAPQMEVSLSGPSRRYLDRQATYRISVSNPGTAPANDVELVTFLPKGMKYVSSSNNGQYDAQNHAVYWSLEELPPSVAGDVELTALPVETGQQKLRVEGRANLGIADAHEQNVIVEGLAELFFDVADSADPIEVGSDTAYQIRVVNQGSKTATNVRLAAALPQSLQATGGDGPTRATISGQQVVFEPLARLAPNSEVIFNIQARGLGAGDHRIRVQISSDESPTPVVKEESTRVYSDR